jgi:hypothetical protein
LFDDGFKKLRPLDPTFGQSIEVFGHAAIGDAIQPCRVDPHLP